MTDQAPPVVIREHDAHRRLHVSDCPGELERDESGMWSCLGARCSFRTVVREQRGVRADQYIDGRSDRDMAF